MRKILAIVGLLLALALPVNAQQQQQPEDYQEFKAAIELLRASAIELGRFYFETPTDPLNHYALVAREIEVGGQLSLVQRRGRRGWFIARPGDVAEIQITIKAIYNVTTGELLVTDLKQRMVGRR